MICERRSWHSYYYGKVWVDAREGYDPMGRHNGEPSTVEFGDVQTTRRSVWVGLKVLMNQGTRHVDFRYNHSNVWLR